MVKNQKILIRNGILVPMVKLTNYFRGDLLIENGKISKINVNNQANESAHLDKIIDATNCFVLPGFIQCHVHTVQTLLRHQADDLELLDWLKKKVWPYEALLNSETISASAQLGIAELLLGGTTAVLDFGTTHDHEHVFRMADQMGIRFFSGKTHMDTGVSVPKNLLEKTESSLRDAYDLGKKWDGRRRIHYVVEPRFALSCSTQLMMEASKMARQNKWLLHTHANENKSEIAQVRKQFKSSNIGYLKKVGFVGKDVVLAHGVHLSDSEIQILKKSKTSICHCPGANLKLASGIADIPKLQKNKINVSLGADGPPCNNRLSIFQEMMLAAGLHKVKSGPKAMSAWNVLEMATINGARALGIDPVVGTLEVGKSADIVLISRDSLALYPDGDPASQIVYGATAADVRDVFVEGEHLVENKKLIKYDISKVQRESEYAWKQIKVNLTK